MVNLARQLVSHNRLTGSIDVYQKCSDELTVLQGSSKQSDSSALSAQASTSIRHQQAPEQQCEQPQQDCTSAPAMRKKHSRLHTPKAKTPDRPDMPRKPDVIVTEIFDSELLGEGVLPTMRHAVKQLLQVCHQSIHFHLASHISVAIMLILLLFTCYHTTTSGTVHGQSRITCTISLYGYAKMCVCSCDKKGTQTVAVKTSQSAKHDHIPVLS